MKVTFETNTFGEKVKITELPSGTIILAPESTVAV